MRTVLQRVQKASVSINNRQHASIGQGLLILLGIEPTDTDQDISWLCGKIARLRIFDDENNGMNLSLCDLNAECLVVSQFTLFASVKKGNRPSYIAAAKPEIAIPLYQRFVYTLETMTQRSVKTGVFGANMQVELINDGPVTILIDTKNKIL